MKAIRRMFVVAVILLGGVLCPPAWAEAAPAEELGATDDCGTCADWIGCGCCAVRVIVPVPEAASVVLAPAAMPSARVDAPAPPSLVEVFHPPRP